MTFLRDQGTTHDLDHSPDVRLSYELSRMCAPAPTSQEVYRQALDSFEPDDLETLIRSFAASSMAHVLLVLPLFIYGSFLALQPDPAPKRVEGPKPTAATFIFKTKEKAPEPKPEVAKTTEPEKVIEQTRPEPKPLKKVSRVAKKRAKTAPRRAPKTEKTEPQIVQPSPAFVAPAVENAEGPTVAAVTTTDPTLPSGPATSPVETSDAEGEVTDFDLKGALAAYKRKLSRALKKDYNYPRAARRAGIEGRAIVRILIDASGNVLSVELASSSGHDILDNAALEAARSVKHVPAAPDSLRWGERHIKVPFRFRAA